MDENGTEWVRVAQSEKNWLHVGQGNLEWLGEDEHV